VGYKRPFKGPFVSHVKGADVRGRGARSLVARLPAGGRDMIERPA
jgi:hypothetical protein